jgi:hypothetical protein
LCEAVKIICAYFLRSFDIYTQNISYVEFPPAIFELGHSTVLIFWSRVSAFCASLYIGEFRCYNEGWRLYQITSRGSVFVCVLTSINK